MHNTSITLHCNVKSSNAVLFTSQCNSVQFTILQCTAGSPGIKAQSADPSLGGSHCHSPTIGYHTVHIERWGITQCIWWDGISHCTYSNMEYVNSSSSHCHSSTIGYHTVHIERWGITLSMSKDGISHSKYSNMEYVNSSRQPLPLLCCLISHCTYGKMGYHTIDMARKDNTRWIWWIQTCNLEKIALFH